MYAAEEEEVIHLDYNSEDEYEINPNDYESESDDDEDVEEGESESKLMEYLLKGLVLQSSTCGSCDTPLVKSLAVDENPATLTSKSKIEPIGNVPFCVSCCAHVVTTQEELQVLWKDEYKAMMGVNGAVLLYMDEVQQQPIFGKMSLASASQSDDEQAGLDLHPPESNEEEEVEEEVEEEEEEDYAEEDEPEEELEDEEEELEEEEEQETIPQPTSRPTSSSTRPTSTSSARSSARPTSATLSRPSSSSARSLNSRRSSGSVSFAINEEDELNLDLIDYDKRRHIATKVLGAKMIEGYTLRETQCERCTMPVMETPDSKDVICVVCPVLQKKILKKMKERKAKDEEERAQELEQLAQEEEERAREEEELAKQRAIEEKEHEELKALEESIQEENRLKEEAIRLEKEEKERQEEELALALEEEAKLVEEQRKLELQNKLEEEKKQLQEVKLRREKQPKAKSTREEESKIMSSEDQRKSSLRKQLEAEKKHLEDLRRRRKMQSQNLDFEEQQMLEDLRLAKEAREAEEQRIIEEERQLAEEKRLEAEEEKRRISEEKEKKRKAQEEERQRLIEELRIAKEARAKEEKRRKNEIRIAEKRAKDAKQAEQARELERIRLIEELRVARQERMMEEMRRKEESIKAKKNAEEAEKMIRLRDEEQSRMKAELEQSLQNQKEQEKIRREEIEKAEEKARAADEQLQRWRETAKEETRRTEEVRKAAEKRAKDAEQAKIDAQKLAAEAKEARAFARAEKARLSERQRLNELAHRAEQHRLAAEAEAQKAQRALLRAEQKELKYTQERQTHEGFLSRQVHEATQKLSKFEKEDELSFSSRLQEQEDRLSEYNMGEPRRMDIEPGLTAASAGQDWEARLRIGKQVLASRLMKGWSVLPEYCFGRMCNFSPIITKGDVTECVICEGSGNGEDGAYEEVRPEDLMEETMSYINKKQRFEKISTSMRRVNFDSSHDVASREVGRRMQLGWQLLESPCPTCLLPLMSETVGSPEVCVFCDPDDDIEIGDEDEDDVPDDNSYSSRRSVTIELPPNFNPNDPYAMAQLAAQAAAASNGQSVLDRSGRNNRPSSRSSRTSRGSQRSNMRPKPQGYGMPNRPMMPPGGRMAPKHMGRQGKLPMRPNRMRSQSPSPEFRGAQSTPRSGGISRGRGRAPNQQPMYVSGHDAFQDDDDASDISDNMSVAKSVASHTLDAIMRKIDDCKVTLRSPIDNSDAQSVARKGEAAALMQKLSAAAAAVKHLE